MCGQLSIKSAMTYIKMHTVTSFPDLVDAQLVHVVLS